MTPPLPTQPSTQVRTNRLHLYVAGMPTADQDAGSNTNIVVGVTFGKLALVFSRPEGVWLFHDGFVDDNHEEPVGDHFEMRRHLDRILGAAAQSPAQLVTIELTGLRTRIVPMHHWPVFQINVD